MIEFRDVSFAYDKHQVVESVSFSIEKGEFVTLIGANGSGKSTIACLTNGLLLPFEGKVSVDGVSTDDISLGRTIKRKVGLVFQNPDNQFIGMTVEEDLAFGLENENIERDEAMVRIASVAELLGIEHCLSSPPYLLSGGEKQKVAIASVLVLMPDYIVLDEVTSLLDPFGRKEILSIVKDLAGNQGKGVLFITHNTEEIVDSDDVLVVSNGKIVLHGGVKEVFADVDFLQSIGISIPPDVYVASILKKKHLVGESVFFEKEILDAICLK